MHLLCLYTVLFTSALVKGEEFSIPTSVTPESTNNETEEYDVEFSKFLVEILENFRNQMEEGIPDAGLPPVEPLVIANIDETISEPTAQMTLKMRHLNITGLSKFHIDDLKADLVKGFVNFSLSLPELSADGYCHMNGKIIGVFPIKSDGPFNIHVQEVKIDGHGDLNMTTGSDTFLHLNDLKLHLTFGPLKMEFQNLMGGGRWTKILVRLLTGLGRNLFLHFHQEAMEELSGILLTVINKELEKGTLSELLDLIQVF